MACTHTRETSRWVEDDDWYENCTATGHWEYDSVSTCVDIDLHRYKCTQCGEVMYYSGRAKQHFEEGVKFDWRARSAGDLVRKVGNIAYGTRYTYQCEKCHRIKKQDVI